MDTIETAAYSTGAATHLIRDLAALAPEQRTPALWRFLADDREPDRVVAAAAIVAATLLGGRQFREPLQTLAATGADARLPAAVPGLGHAALQALTPVAASWARDADRRDTIAALTQVLTFCGNVLDDLDHIWNDACDYGADGEVPDGTPPGIAHLAALLRLHGSMMGGGTYFGMEVNEEFRVRRAIEGLRYFDLAGEADLLEDILRRFLDDEPSEEWPELGALLDGDALDEAFRAKAALSPADFAQ